MQEILKNIAPESKIFGINPHKLGPVFAVLQVLDQLDLSKPTIVNYAVFLGGQAAILNQSINIKDLENNDFNKPDFIFVLGEGVFESHKVSKSKKAQLKCYYEVLIRQPIEERLSVLPHKAIIELLNWDAEKYRQAQSL